VTPESTAIRTARPEDARDLADLMERTFRDAFGAVNRPEHLATHVARSYGPVHQQRELADPAITTLLAEVEGELAGYAQIRQGETPAEITGAAPIQLWRFYVDQRWHGRGVAQTLMAAVQRAARQLGAETLWLGVWEENPRGIAFYRKCGFGVVGTFLFHVGDDPQRDLIMVHQLGPAS
jgi:ribosomal protein S18 acetylase RimI-like enzyme